MDTAFVLCTRSNSTRILNKPFVKINGKRLIEHLIDRLLATGIPVIVAIPERDIENYKTIRQIYGHKINWYMGFDDNPLARMVGAINLYDLDTVIRVNHDKIFINKDTITKAIIDKKSNNIDYLYSSSFTDGSGFEVINAQCVKEAAMQFTKPCEHISYAIRAITENIKDMEIEKKYKSMHRLLIDYPEDLKVLEVVLSRCGNDCTLLDAIHFLDHNAWVSSINMLPKITIYTCVHNGEKHLEQAASSVVNLESFKSRMEYIIVDDFSSDSTPYKCAYFEYLYPNVKWIRNDKNLGLSDSSNIALKNARGKYIIRLDADDFFVGVNPLDPLVDRIESSPHVDIVYPDNFYGSYERRQLGDHDHHVGGALFRTSALNHVKFTDRLRHHDSLDVYTRAKSKLAIGYLHKPIFFYRQRNDSMSKTELDRREQIKQMIINETNI